MVTTAQIAEGAGRGVLSAGIVAAHATKYGLNLGKDCVKWMCGLANELANQFAPGGINTKIGDKVLDTSAKVAGDGLDLAVKAMKNIKGKLR